MVSIVLLGPAEPVTADGDTNKRVKMQWFKNAERGYLSNSAFSLPFCQFESPKSQSVSTGGGVVEENAGALRSAFAGGPRVVSAAAHVAAAAAAAAAAVTAVVGKCVSSSSSSSLQ